MKVKKEEAARAKKEAEEKAARDAEDALPEEERIKIQNKREAEAIKAQGNEYYKKREFDQALEYYQQAIDRCPEELTYYSNKAACFFEMKKFDDCIQACDDGAEAVKGKSYDYVKLAKSMARKANALFKLGRFDESIDQYQSALLENQDHGIKMGL